MKPNKPPGLLRTILTRVLPSAMIVLATVSFVVINYVSRTVSLEVQIRLEENVNRASELISNKLTMQQDYVKALAKNELLINSLVNSQEQQWQLPLFFRSLKPPGGGEAEIMLTDYRGRTLASNGSTNTLGGTDWVADVMQGKERLVISSQELVVAAPVLFANRPEGMVVLKYAPRSFKSLFDLKFDECEVAVLDGLGNLLSEPSSQVPLQMLRNAKKTQAGWVQHRIPVNGYSELRVAVFQSTTQAYERVSQLSTVLIITSLLSVLALTAVTVITVRMTINPLTSLIDKIKATHGTSDLAGKLEVHGPEEFQTLAISFNEMLARLEQATVSRDHLETLNEQLCEKTVAIELANQQLKKSNEELKQFAYVASHDLQEPLRKVNSFCQILAEEYQDQLDDDAKLYIHHAVSGAVRMKTLVTDLLDYSRVESQGKPIAPTNANTACAEAISNLETAIEESTTKITVDSLPTILADRTQLVRLFQNLISNAIKYAGNIQPEIHIGANEEQDDWVIFIQDNGIGIDPKFHEQIFGMFQRLHARDEYTGTGIGLAICKRIVDRLSGHISIKSEIGFGSTFFITVPKLPTTFRKEAEEHEISHAVCAEIY